MVIISYVLLFLSNLLISACYYIKDVLIEVNLYELVYYYTNDKSGYGNGTVVFMAILNCLWVFILLSVFVILILLLVKKYKPLIFDKFLIIFAVLFFLFSVILTIKISKTDSYIYHKSKTSDLYEKYYVDTNKVNVTFPKKKNNLILIYLESMESSFASKSNGGAFEESRIPELENIALHNTNFSNSDKLGGAYTLYGTTWTVGAMTAQTAGVPLKLSIEDNAMGEYSTFLGGAYSLGQVLQKNGYHNYLLLGSDATFGGRRNLFEQHGNYEIWDFESARNESRVDEKIWWGYTDDQLFEYAKEK